VERRLVAVDVGIAIMLFAWSLAEVWGSEASSLVGPLWVNSAAYGIAALLVAVRRWRPLAVLLTQCVVLSIPVLVWGASESLAGVFPLLVVIYTVAAQCPRRQVVIAFAAVTTTAVLAVVRDPLLEFPGALLAALPFLVLVALACLLGEYARTRNLYASSLRERVQVAEREADHVARLAVLEERQRVAQELHDVIAHGLIVMIRQVEAGLARFATDPARAEASLEAVAATGRDALTELRHLVAILDGTHDGAASHPPEIGEPVGGQAPGLSSLQGLADRMTTAGLTVRVNDRHGPDAVPRGIDVAAYRIVQEALTNALRHGHADSAVVLVRREGDALVVEIEDDGEGAPPGAPMGHGLLGMRERARLFSGTVSMLPAKPHGCRISAHLPLPQTVPPTSP
jgi:signal transduction histidine kinase